jgi:hypothetical protein
LNLCGFSRFQGTEQAGDAEGKDENPDEHGKKTCPWLFDRSHG